MANDNTGIYRPENVAEARSMPGATDLQLASHFGVSLATLQLWIVCYPEFSNALRQNKEETNDAVERALLHRALGYTFDSEKVFVQDGETIRVPTQEHVPPDVSACTLWLKNRRPEHWHDKRELDLSIRGRLQHEHVDLTSLTTEELQRRYLEALHVVEDVREIASPAGDGN